MKIKAGILLIMFFCVLYPISTAEAEVKHYTYEIVNTFPHDREAFTQGFAFQDGYIYEGTGKRGKSSLQKVEVESGKVLNKRKLPAKYFGEGITIHEEKIYQLTWKKETGFIYDMEFNLLDKFHYQGEGWGLASDGSRLIMSNGSSKLYFLNPDTLEKEREITVTLEGKPVNKINELEYIEGEIFANVWYEDHILIIDPETGEITGVLDLKGIINPENYDYSFNVLNGITYDKKQNRIFVTGKLWPKIFEIEIIRN